MNETKKPMGRPTKEYPKKYILVRGTDKMHRYIKARQPEDLHTRMLIYKDACDKYYAEQTEAIKRAHEAQPRQKKQIF